MTSSVKPYNGSLLVTFAIPELTTEFLPAGTAKLHGLIFWLAVSSLISATYGATATLTATLPVTLTSKNAKPDGPLVWAIDVPALIPAISCA